MRTVVVDATELTYSVYEGRALVAKFKSDKLLNGDEIEDLRQAEFNPLEVA